MPSFDGETVPDECILCKADASKTHWGIYHHYDEYVPQYLDGCGPHARICMACAGKLGLTYKYEYEAIE